MQHNGVVCMLNAVEDDWVISSAQPLLVTLKSGQFFILRG